MWAQNMDTFFLKVRIRNQSRTASIMFAVEGLKEDYSRVLEGIFL